MRWTEQDCCAYPRYVAPDGAPPIPSPNEPEDASGTGQESHLTQGAKFHCQWRIIHPQDSKRSGSRCVYCLTLLRYVASERLIQEGFISAPKALEPLGALRLSVRKRSPAKCHRVHSAPAAAAAAVASVTAATATASTRLHHRRCRAHHRIENHSV